MTYFKPYIDDAGLHIPTYADIRDDIIARFKGIYGDDLYLDNDSQDYQMISVFALKTYDTMQLLQLVYNNHSPKTAVGTALSSLVKLNGIERKAASYSTCVLTLTGTPGTTIAYGVAEDNAGHRWNLPESLTFESDTIETSATCADIGAITAIPGTITKISNPQYGWTAVTNKVPAVPGEPIETDEELRARQSISVAIPSQNMLDGTIAGIRSVSGVTKCRVYDNDTGETDANGIPSHSIAAVVEGGEDADIARQIYLRKGPGGGTYGSTTYEYTHIDGGKTAIRFFRPIYQAIDVHVTITKGTGYGDITKESIRVALKEYIESIGIGYSVSMTGLIASVTSVITNRSLPAFYLQSITAATSGSELKSEDIPIAYNAIATVGEILVEVA